MNNVMTNTLLLKSAPQKLYLQLADLLRGQIRSGQRPPSAKLPPMEEIARQFGIAVVTVRQAIAVLEKEGLVRRHHGRGTFVEGDFKERNIWLRMESRWNSLIEKWDGIEPKIVAVRDHVPCPPSAVREGTPAVEYHYMRRVHIAEHLPYAMVDIYLAEHIYKRAPKRFNSERILYVLESLPAIKIKQAREILTVSTADIEAVRLLDIALNSPVGAVSRTLIDQHGILIYIAEVTYRGDVVRIERNLDL